MCSCLFKVCYGKKTIKFVVTVVIWPQKRHLSHAPLYEKGLKEAKGKQFSWCTELSARKSTQYSMTAWLVIHVENQSKYKAGVDVVCLSDCNNFEDHRKKITTFIRIDMNFFELAADISYSLDTLIVRESVYQKGICTYIMLRLLAISYKAK